MTVGSNGATHCAGVGAADTPGGAPPVAGAGGCATVYRAWQEQQKQKAVAAHKKAGDAALEKDDFDGALAAYMEGLEVDPENKTLTQAIETAKEVNTPGS